MKRIVGSLFGLVLLICLCIVFYNHNAINTKNSKNSNEDFLLSEILVGERRRLVLPIFAGITGASATAIGNALAAGSLAVGTVSYGGTLSGDAKLEIINNLCKIKLKLANYYWYDSGTTDPCSSVDPGKSQGCSWTESALEGDIEIYVRWEFVDDQGNSLGIGLDIAFEMKSWWGTNWLYLAMGPGRINGKDMGDLDDYWTHCIGNEENGCMKRVGNHVRGACTQTCKDYIDHTNDAYQWKYANNEFTIEYGSTSSRKFFVKGNIASASSGKIEVEVYSDSSSQSTCS